MAADAALAIPLGRDDTPQLDAPAPLEIPFAPVTTGWRARAGGAYHAALSARWRLRAAVDAYLDGAENASPLILRGALLADLAVGARGRLAFGVYVWNADQHAVDDDGERVRSGDVLPVVEFIYTSWTPRAQRIIPR